MRNDAYTPSLSQEATAVAPLNMVSPESGPLGILRLPGVTNHQDSASMSTEAAFSPSALPSRGEDRDKVLPLPSWLRRLYFIFPVVLYVPDVIFNYVVYSDGVQPSGNTIALALSYVLWGFLSVGVVGMAYLLSVLAPWHWGQGHHIQAFFCGVGVVIATVITTWNSLAFRSKDFVKFPTDDWAYSIWPQFHSNGVSITMILVAIAPPFWGLFWAIVQPTQTGRSLRQLQESHQERLMRMQQEAELKRLKAETNAKVREAQLRGMAATAATARQQAAAVVSSSTQKRGLGGTTTEGHPLNGDASKEDVTQATASPASARPSEEPGEGAASSDLDSVSETQGRAVPQKVDEFEALVERTARTVRVRGEVVTPDAISAALAEQGYRTPADTTVAAALARIGDRLRERTGTRRARGSAGRSTLGTPSKDDKRFPSFVYNQATQLLRDGQPLTLRTLSDRVQQPIEVVQETVQKLREERTANLRPGQDLSDDPVLSNPNL